ncbi:hypothetical protein TNCV_1360191 [Trichonephila clavipes]|nr:hypothetical protein TNCV_1360191 [Trichonephila clavipes]
MAVAAKVSWLRTRGSVFESWVCGTQCTENSPYKHITSAVAESPPVGVMSKLGELVLEQVPFSSFDRGYGLRNLSPIVLVLLYSAT